MRQRLDITDVEAQHEDPCEVPARARERGVRDAAGPDVRQEFLRTYAEFLGLDPHLLVEEYRARHDPRGRARSCQPFAPPARRRAERRGAGRGAGPWLPVAGRRWWRSWRCCWCSALTGDDDNGGDRDADHARPKTTTTSASDDAADASETPPPPTRRGAADRAAGPDLRLRGQGRRDAGRLRGHDSPSRRRSMASAPAGQPRQARRAAVG